MTKMIIKEGPALYEKIEDWGKLNCIFAAMNNEL